MILNILIIVNIRNFDILCLALLAVIIHHTNYDSPLQS